jgi:hypothetical protein
MRVGDRLALSLGANAPDIRRKKIDPPCEPHHTRSPENGVEIDWPEVDV